MVGTISSTELSKIDGIFLWGSPSRSGKEMTKLRQVISMSFIVPVIAAEFWGNAQGLSMSVSVAEKS